MKLLEPIRVGKYVFKNRIVMPAMETRLNTVQGDVTNEMVDYYAQRAKGGVAAIIVENTFIDDKESRSSLISSGLYSDHLIKGKNLLAEAIQDNGAIAIIQLSHGGRQANGRANPLQPVAPSAVMCGVTQRMPRPLTKEEIIEIEDAFVQAAVRAKNAGFDGVEIHGAHGYLICSFLSPYTNKRDDEYGGSADNRARFAVNILKKVREAVGEYFIVGFRISGSEFIEGGLTLEDTCAFIPKINHFVDYISVSGAIYESAPLWNIAAMYVPGGQLVFLAEAIKKVATKPVITVGSLDHVIGEKVLQEGQADIIALGRALIADPNIPRKLMQNMQEDILPCCRGNEGCLTRFYEGKAIRCELNPACGREREYKITPTLNPKKIIVAGGGIAGMEAARVADLMGHRVILFEQTDHLGGHLTEGSVPSFKNKTSDFLTWLQLQLKKSTVAVKLNMPATPELIARLQPDALIIAVGSHYADPEITGIEHALHADKALLESVPHQSVAVVGGGLIGAETALFLAEQGKKVTIIEMKSEIVPDHEANAKQGILTRLQLADVAICTNEKVRSITENRVKCESGLTVDCGCVVNATGLAPNMEEANKLRGIVPETYVIGDCLCPRKIFNAMHEAWRVCFEINES